MLEQHFDALLYIKATREPLERWVTLLPEAERNAFLVRIARGETQVGTELLRRLREIGGARPTPVAPNRRTFAELQAAAERQKQLRERREREAAERSRLAKREALVWASIPGLLAKRTASGYNEGVGLLAELRDLAAQRGQQATFKARLAEVTAPYAGSPALQRRLKEQRLV